MCTTLRLHAHGAPGNLYVHAHPHAPALQAAVLASPKGCLCSVACFPLYHPFACFEITRSTCDMRTGCPRGPVLSQAIHRQTGRSMDCKQPSLGPKGLAPMRDVHAAVCRADATVSNEDIPGAGHRRCASPGHGSVASPCSGHSLRCALQGCTSDMSQVRCEARRASGLPCRSVPSLHLMDDRCTRVCFADAWAWAPAARWSCSNAAQVPGLLPPRVAPGPLLAYPWITGHDACRRPRFTSGAATAGGTCARCRC